MRPFPRWLLLWSLLGFGFLAGIIIKCYLPADGLFDVTGYLIGRDFVNVWMASHLLQRGDIQYAYDIHQFIAAMREIFGHDFPFHNWSYPPTILPFILPFASLPYSSALMLWSVLGLTFYALAIQPKKLTAYPLLAVLLLATAPASIVNLLSGQNGFFTAACFLGGFGILTKRPWAAGILFGLLTIKPHLGIIIPFALLLLGQWRAIASAALTTFTLMAVSVAIWDVNPWYGYVTSIAPYQHELLLLFKGFYAAMMPGPYAAARVISLPHETAMLLQSIAAFAAAILSLSILTREGTSARAILGLAIAAMLLTPYGYNYDMTIVSGALLLYVVAHPPGRYERLFYGLLWLLPAATFAVMFAHLPLAPLMLFSVLFYLAWQSQQATALSSSA